MRWQCQELHRQHLKDVGADEDLEIFERTCLPEVLTKKKTDLFDSIYANKENV